MNILKYVALAFVLSSACEQSMGCAMWREFSYSNGDKYSSVQDFKSKLLTSIGEDLEQKALSNKIAGNIGPTYGEIKTDAGKKLREQNNEIKDEKCKKDDTSVNEWIGRNGPDKRVSVLRKIKETQENLKVREQLEKTKNLYDFLKSLDTFKSLDTQYEDEVYNKFVAVMFRINCLDGKNGPAGNEDDFISKILSDLNYLKGGLSAKIKMARTQKSDVIEKSTRTKFTTEENLDPESIYTAFLQKENPTQYLQEVINENLAETCLKYVMFLRIDFLRLCTPNMWRCVENTSILEWCRKLNDIDGFEDIFMSVTY